MSKSISSKIKNYCDTHGSCGSKKTNKELSLNNDVIEEESDIGKKFKKANLVTMPDIMAHYVEESLKLAKTMEDKEKMIMFGIGAWNISYFNESEQKQEIDDFLKIMRVDSDFLDTMRDAMRQLIHRKKTQYPDINRLIIDYALSGTVDTPYLKITSVVFDIKNPRSSANLIKKAAHSTYKNRLIIKNAMPNRRI